MIGLLRPRDVSERREPCGADFLEIAGCVLSPLASPIKYVVKVAIAPMRFLVRYFEKRRPISKSDGESLSKLTQYSSNSVGPDKSLFAISVHEIHKISPRPVGKEAKLEEVLTSSRPILESFVRTSHYDDILNLCLASPTIRAAIGTQCTEWLKRTSCIAGSKLECWSCQSQICKVLFPLLPIPQALC